MPRRIAILGAGICGLATAWYLKQLDPKLHVMLIEKSDRAGGWIQTVQMDGFLFEQGPKSIRTRGAGVETLRLIQSLGLESEVIVPSKDAASRFVYDGKGLQALPKHLYQIPLHPLTSGWLKALWRDWQAPKREVEDESISAFFSRRIGEEWVDRLIDPFVLGIFAGDCRRLSLKSCFPQFDEWERQEGSLFRGAFKHPKVKTDETPFIKKISTSPLFSFRGGMEVLPLALHRKLKEELFLNSAAIGLEFQGSEAAVQLADGRVFKADLVISTLPAFALGPLLAPAPQLQAQAKLLPYASVVVVNVGFKGKVDPLKGFGFLVPSKFNQPVLGCVLDSCIFPEQDGENQTRLTFMLGGMHRPEIADSSDGAIEEIVLKALSEHLGILEKPAALLIKKAKQAIPQFEMGYLQWKKEFEVEACRFFPQLMLSGSCWGGVSINDCIAQASRLAKRIV